jgi:lysophospholipase L1-like esterase
MAEGLVQWAGSHPHLAQVTVTWGPGCGFIRGGRAEFEVPSYRAACDDMLTGLPDVLLSRQPDIVVLMVTIGDTEARRLTDDGELLRPGDTRFTGLIDAQYDAFFETLLAGGVERVAWVVPPTPDTELHVLAPHLGDPARWSTLRAAVERMAAGHPDVVNPIDLEGWEAAQAESSRPDGLHFSVDAARRLADTMLAPTLVDLALR